MLAEELHPPEELYLAEELNVSLVGPARQPYPRPPYSVRFRVLPGGDYELTLEQVQALEQYIAETIASETGLSVRGRYRQVESQGLLVRQETENVPRTVFQGGRVVVLPGIESRMNVVDGKPMDLAAPVGSELAVWIHYISAYKDGLIPEAPYELYDARTRTSVPIRLAGRWIAVDPGDTFWDEHPDETLQKAIIVRESAYRAVLEPVFKQQLRSASWHVVLDHDQLAPEHMRAHAEGLRRAIKRVEQELTRAQSASAPKTHSPLLDALDRALQRESDLTVLMFVLSVPIMGFMLYFLALISSITIRWQRRETAVMVSRGMRGKQLLAVTLIEAGAIIVIGTPLGILLGLQLAQALGYTASFMRFVPRTPLPVSITAINPPMLVAALSALILARLWPVLRSTRTSVIAHEQRRARATQRPFWQRFYLDVLLLIPIYYAYRQLSVKGTLVPGMESRGTTGSQRTLSDPLLFLVPTLFILTMSLLAVRLFPLLMRLADTILTLGRRTTLYLAFRQLARQSDQYVSALLLAITALSLGGFVASTAASLDNWLHDQVYYDVGADLFVQQTYDPVALSQATVPADGAWMLPLSSYLEVPGVIRAARVGMYPATTQISSYETVRGTFIGIDRVDMPGLLFFRRDFGAEPLGSLMNQLGIYRDAVLIPDRLMALGRFEIGDKIPVNIVLVDLFDHKVEVKAQFTVAGSFASFPTFYETVTTRPSIRPRGNQSTGEAERVESLPTAAFVGNLDYLFELVGGPELHDLWFSIEPNADSEAMRTHVQEMKVYIRDWREARRELETEFAQPERVGTLGTLTVGFLAAATFAAIGLLIYNYASLQERLFRFSILRAMGISRPQVVAQVAIEYVILMLYGVATGATIAVWASRLFIPFFQTANAAGGTSVALRPPRMLPVVAWRDIGLICAAFAISLILAQTIMLLAALRKGVFQALRMGDRE
jgi:putative ABC transport system permease protein